MIEKMKQIPTGLKVVCLIHAALGILFMFVIIAELAFSNTSYEKFFVLDGYDRVTTYGGLALSVLTVLGIIDRSQFIRKLLIIFAVIGFLVSFAALIWDASLLELTITVGIDVTIIWGLTNSKSKAYFEQKDKTIKA